MVPTINVPETLLATADELIDWRHVAPQSAGRWPQGRRQCFEADLAVVAPKQYENRCGPEQRQQDPERNGRAGPEQGRRDHASARRASVPAALGGDMEAQRARRALRLIVDAVIMVGT